MIIFHISYIPVHWLVRRLDIVDWSRRTPEYVRAGVLPLVPTTAGAFGVGIRAHAVQSMDLTVYVDAL